MSKTASMLPKNVSAAIAAMPKTTRRIESRAVDICRNDQLPPRVCFATLPFASVVRIDFDMNSFLYLFLLLLV